MSRKEFGIVVTAKMRHGDLWDVAKKIGSASALARHLEISAQQVGRWINLQDAPSAGWLDTERGRQVMDKLLLLCNRTAEELWPVELRKAIGRGEIGERIERRQEVALHLLAYRSEERLTLPSPDEVAVKTEAAEILTNLLDRLPPRYRKVLTLRLGLDGNRPHTLDEVSNIIGVGCERVRQIEANAIRKLRNYGCELSDDARDTLLT